MEADKAKESEVKAEVANPCDYILSKESEAKIL
jgi:hypothetical protein